MSREGDPICSCGNGLAIILMDDGKKICSICWVDREKAKEVPKPNSVLEK